MRKDSNYSLRPRILLLCTYYSGGGAAVSARRLLEGLRAHGYDARLLVSSPLPSDAPHYVRSVHSLWQRGAFYAERISLLRTLRFDRTRLFRFSSASIGVDISRHPWVRWADVIHLHWVQQGFLSLSGLERLLSLEGKKVLWSLHDLWPITGGCHIPYTMGEDGTTHFCSRYRHHCGQCPILGAHDTYDLSYRIHERKSRWQMAPIQFFGVSTYVTEQVRESALTSDSIVSCLPNMVDPRIFRPVPKIQTRARRTLLFVAARPDDPVKGLDLCRQVLEHACHVSEDFARETDFVCIGAPKVTSALAHWALPLRHIPRVTPEELVAHYREATLTLSTSRFETFGQTILESIACGTPAVAFDVGGISDIIRPEAGNGVLVSPYDVEEMARQIVRLSEPCYPHPTPEEISATVVQYHVSEVVRTYIQLLPLGQRES